MQTIRTFTSESPKIKVPSLIEDARRRRQDEETRAIERPGATLCSLGVSGE